jgi:hypothetical protein
MKSVALLALLALASTAAAVTVPTTCPAPSAGAISCMQGMVLTMAPTVNFCSCTCGSTMSSAVSSDSDMNSLVLQAASAGACTQAACHTAFQTTCAAVGANGYVSARFVEQQALITRMDWITAVSVPSGAGSICTLISVTCDPTVHAMGCPPFLDGVTMTTFDNINATVASPDSVATSCADLLADAPQWSSLGSNLHAFTVCNTNNCNVLTSDTSAARAHTVAAALLLAAGTAVML